MKGPNPDTKYALPLIDFGISLAKCRPYEMSALHVVSCVLIFFCEVYRSERCIFFIVCLLRRIVSCVLMFFCKGYHGFFYSRAVSVCGVVCDHVLFVRDIAFFFHSKGVSACGVVCVFFFGGISRGARIFLF